MVVKHKAKGRGGSGKKVAEQGVWFEVVRDGV